MSFGWNEIPIGNLTTPVERFEATVPGRQYRQVGVRLWGEGAYERESIDGGETKYKQLNRTSTGDIIVNKIWARNGSVSVILPGQEDCFVSGEFPLFSPVADRLDPRWFYWITKTRWFWHRCDLQSRGTSGKNRIKPRQFLAIDIPLPPLAEQRRIVAKIEALAEKIEEAQGLRVKTVKAQELLWQTGARNVLKSMPDELWQPIGDLADVRGGSTPSKKNSEFWGGDIPWVSPKDMKVWEITDSQDHITQLAVDAKPNCLVDPDTVLVVIRGMILAHTVPSAVLGVEAAINQDMKALTFRDDFLPEYVVRCLWALNRDILELVDRSGHDTRKLNTDKLMSFRIPVTSVDEQDRIVEYLDGLQAKVDELKALQAQTQKELDALLPSVLDKAFKGELVEAQPGVVEVQSARADRLFDTSPELEQDYAVDAAVAVLVLDDYRKRDKQAREFHQQKLAYIAQRAMKLPVRSEFEKMPAGPWSADFRDAVGQIAGDNGWFRYTPCKDRKGDLARPGDALADGVVWAKGALGDRVAKVASLLREFRRFGDSGLERWATVLKVTEDLQEAGQPVTRRAIQQGVDNWPGKRDKKWFSRDDVNQAIDGLVAKGWLEVRGE
jgi:type I restriction enzyme S subunit